MLKKAYGQGFMSSVMVIFLNQKDFIYQHALSKGQTIIATNLQDVLMKMIHHFLKKSTNKKVEEILFHHDNVRLFGCVYFTNVILEFSTRRSIKIIAHSPYSSDLAFCDFWLFPLMKKPLWGWRFVSNLEVRESREDELHGAQWKRSLIRI